VGNRCADHVTPLYPQKLALTSPTGGGRSVGIVRMRTKATEFVYHCYLNRSDKLCEFLALSAVHLRCPFLRNVATRHLVDWWQVISKQRSDLISKVRRAQCLEMLARVTMSYSVI